VTTTTTSDVYYDPYDAAIDADPYPTFRRLREEAPLYYNEPHDFYALSRYEDVERALIDKDTFISGRGVTVGILEAGIDLPPGTVLMEDPPAHTIHRRLLSRLFTARQLTAIEPKTRQFCADLLDPLVGSGGFDFVQDVGAPVPTKVISMLIGIPESDTESVRDQLTGFGEDREPGGEMLSGELFAEYIDWRVQHPSDDIMTQLLYAEFEDEHGEVRRLTRTELLAYVNIVALAGNHTTRLLIGWIGKLLSDHPDQRRLLLEDRSLIPGAVEECMRAEGPTGAAARYVARDVEVRGQVIPEGSHAMLLVLSANHDERRFDDPDRFDITRAPGNHLTLGFGTHYCLGQALARLEARIVLEEVLERFPEWTVDEGGIELHKGEIDLRGFDRLPVSVP